MGPMLVLLAALSVTRPVGWTVASYLQARQLPQRIFLLEAFKLCLLVGGIVSYGRISPLWTCGAVGMAFAGHAGASLWVVRQVDGIPLRRSLGSLWPALAACVVMALAVLATRAALSSAAELPAALRLAVEVLSGALAYVAAALLLARSASRELYAKLRVALRPRASS
jgi:PST family polysaccharide transporter